MNRKGFTLVEILAVVVVLGILLTLAMAAYTGYKKSSSDKSFKLLVNSCEDALKEAYVDCNSGFSNNKFCTSHAQPGTGQKVKVILKDLITYEYLDEIKNPYNTSEKCDVNTSYIESGNFNEDANGNTTFSYRVCLVCGSKQSEGCNSTFVVPNVVGMTLADAKKVLTNWQINYTGSGNKITKQVPAANEKLTFGGTVTLTLGN